MRLLRLGIPVLGLGLVLLGGACSQTPALSPQPDAGSHSEPPDAQEWAPRFGPDYNTLQPRPGVEVASADQARNAVVKPDSLEFSRTANPEVLEWQPGRLVVAGPSDGPGANLLGFARRVKSVSTVGPAIVVHTEAAALQDIVTGELQQTLDFSRMKEVSLSELDLAWAADHLYIHSEVLSPEISVRPDGGVAADSAAGAVAKDLMDAWRAVTPGSFEMSASISPELKVSQQAQLFSLDLFTKGFNENGRVPLELAITGTGELSVDLTFKPGAQLGLRIPNAGHEGTFAAWLNVDSNFQSKLQLEVALEATVAGAGGKHGGALEQALSEQAEWAQEVLNGAREKFLDAPDMKPAGAWKRTLFITRPATQTVMAGPVPVVFTQTFQVDLECGFEAKAELKAKVEYEHTTALKFSARYEDGKVTADGQPRFESRKDHRVEVTGGGGASVSCGLIPRINVFVYDTAGLNVGVRGSLVARAAYEEQCRPDFPGTTPRSEVNLGLYGNFGLQVGGRLQTPGSSYGQKAGQEQGFDIGPIEVWNTESSIYSQVWSLEGGLGYCTPPCHGKCGGSCPKCAVGMPSAVASDCVSGVTDGQLCVSGTCWDRTLSGGESDIDCGGPESDCRRCDEGQKCVSNVDCAESSPVCDRMTGVCSVLRCSDGIKNGDETSIDCGGGCSYASCGTAAALCGLGRGSCGASSSLRLDAPLMPRSARPDLTPPRAAAPSVAPRGDVLASVLQLPAPSRKENRPTSSNPPASRDMQSEVPGAERPGATTRQADGT